MSSPKILVTGGSGFIGGSLVLALVKRGYTVRAFYRAGDDNRLIAKAPVELIEGDICDPDKLKQAAAGCQTVFHTAGNVSFRKQDRASQFRVNVKGTGNVVQTCIKVGVKKLIYTSTVNTLGIAWPTGSIADEDTPFDPEKSDFNYAYTKKLAEDIALAANGSAIEVVSVNPGTVFGPGDVNLNAGSYIMAIAKAPVWFYPPGGTNCVHVDAVVAGHIAALQSGRAGERYILGGENLYYREVFSIIADVLGRPRPKFSMPTYPLVLASSLIEKLSALLGFDTKIAAEAAKAGQHTFFYSSEKARRELNLEMIPFRRAVEEAVAWYRQENILKV
ncbi:MAG: NAD-dependent epimerase/dehydratase family protein [Deltaproteobacteria bacterium]|nr:NAD-dependent epimerase/dehydratase family protein [Deltaproteobacteria bacterium]